MNMVHRILEKCKQAGDTALLRIGNVFKNEDIFIVAIIILVGFGGFGLGRLSRIRDEKSPVVIDGVTPFGTAVAGGEENEVRNYELGIMNGRNYVASVGGTKYHLPWCSGAERIKEENKIWFATEDEARAAGYGPAGNCKGL